MARTQGFLVILTLWGQLGVAVWTAARPPTPPISSVVAAHPRWEYRVAVIPDGTFSATMGALGAEGWALVSARRANTAPSPLPMEMAYEVILQRPVQPAPTLGTLRAP